MSSEGTELAKAYVQIVPSAKGIKGSITKELGGEAGSAGEAAGESLGKSLVGKIKAIVAAAGIAGMVKESLMLGADLEQSIGGIETLFGTGGDSIEEYAKKVGKSVSAVRKEYTELQKSQETMFKYADEAYKTAGLSANDYMQTVTGFAASLKQSTGGDMKALTTAANQAVIDMADNANKMGTSMESIQNAYQGFAKQNYTMLDNLKLGYGGTKKEMQRLLADASALAGVEYDIDNLADVYAAIHVIQDQLGITGTTAKEAASTFSGSLASMKSAKENFLAKMALGEDIKPALKSMHETTKTFVVDNLLPMLWNITSAIPELVTDWINTLVSGIKDAIPKIVDFANSMVTSIKSFIDENLPVIISFIVDSANSMVTSIKSFIDENLPVIISFIKEMIPQIISVVNEMSTLIVSFLITKIPLFIEHGMDIVLGLINGIKESIGKLKETAQELIVSFVEELKNRFPLILQKGIEILENIIIGIFKMIPELILAINFVVSSIIEVIYDAMAPIISSGIDIVLNLIDGIIECIPDIIEAAGEVMNTFIGFIVDKLPDILNKGSEIIGRLTTGIANSMPNVISSISKVIATMLKTIIEHLPDILKAGFNLLGELIAGIIKALPIIFEAIPKVVDAIKDVFKNTDWNQVGSNILTGIKEGILGAVDTVIAAAKNAASSIYESVKSFFDIGSPSKLMRDEIGKWIPAGIAVGIEGNVDSVTQAMDELSEASLGRIDMSALDESSKSSRSSMDSYADYQMGQYESITDNMMLKFEEVTEAMLEALERMQLTAVIPEDTVFQSMRRRGQEWKEQTGKPAFG